MNTKLNSYRVLIVLIDGGHRIHSSVQVRSYDEAQRLRELFRDHVPHSITMLQTRVFGLGWRDVDALYFIRDEVHSTLKNLEFDRGDQS